MMINSVPFHICIPPPYPPSHTSPTSFGWFVCCVDYSFVCLFCVDYDLCRTIDTFFCLFRWFSVDFIIFHSNLARYHGNTRQGQLGLSQSILTRIYAARGGVMTHSDLCWPSMNTISHLITFFFQLNRWNSKKKRVQQQTGCRTRFFHQI